MRAAAVFDLDGTLIRGTSAERLLAPWLWREGVVGLRQAAAALATAATLPWAGPTRALRSNKQWLRGVAVSEVIDRMDRFLREVVEPRWSRPVLTRLERFRSDDVPAYLLTGAPRFIADAVCRHLSLDGALATELEVREGRFTGRLAGPHRFAGQKVVALETLARRAELDLGRSWGFADHGSDVDFLACFGRPVAVAPDRGLRRMATTRGWEVMEG